MNGIFWIAASFNDGYINLLGTAVYILNNTMGLEAIQNIIDYVKRLG